MTDKTDKQADREFLAHVDDIEFKAGLDGAAEECIVEGYASRFGEKDDGNDIVVKGAFKESLKDRGPGGKIPVPFLYGHNRQGLPIGYFLELYEDGVGLRFKAKLLTAESEAARVIYALAKAKQKFGISIGYRTIEKSIVVPDKLGSEGNEYSPGAVRKLIKLDLYEISAVPVAMLKTAVITGCKAADEEQAPTPEALQAKALAQLLETETQSFALKNMLEQAAATFGR